MTTAQAQEPPPATPDRTDQPLAGILAGALATSDATFWPGYRFAADPLMAYRPGGWAVLIGFPNAQPARWEA